MPEEERSQNGSGGTGGLEPGGKPAEERPRGEGREGRSEDPERPGEGRRSRRSGRWRGKAGGRGPEEGVIPNPKAKLLDQLREVMRVRHYSLRTERSYRDWVRRYIRFHRMKLREELFPGEDKARWSCF